MDEFRFDYWLAEQILLLAELVQATTVAPCSLVDTENQSQPLGRVEIKYM